MTLIRRSSDRPRGSLACLAVPEVAAAIDFYERYLGFSEVSRSQDGSAAVVRRDGSHVMLRRVATESRASGDRAYHAWDALVGLRDFDATYALLAVRGVELVGSVTTHPLLGRTITVADRYGNHIGLHDARGVRVALRHRLNAASTRLAARRFERSVLTELRPHYEAFVRFYEGLRNKRDIFYMFFTTGLVHWVVKAASFVPASVNLVLLGAHLSSEEREWIKKNLDRPFHHIDHHVNDWPVWDWLLAANRNNFGWLDIDCLVLNPGVFDEITVMADDASINAIWSYESGSGYRIANTYLVYLNVAAIRSLREQGITVWARPHDWRGGDRTEHGGPRCFYRVPSARERRLMLTVTLPDPAGRPSAPGSRDFFDTLSVYQILARAGGFRVHQVRRLENPMLGPVEPGQVPSLAPQEMTDELVHVGGISYYREHFHNPSVRIRYLAADYLALRDLVTHLPPGYLERLRTVRAELHAHGVNPDHAEADLRAYLADVGGLGPVAIEQVLATTWAAP